MCLSYKNHFLKCPKILLWFYGSIIMCLMQQYWNCLSQLFWTISHKSRNENVHITKKIGHTRIPLDNLAGTELYDLIPMANSYNLESHPHLAPLPVIFPSSIINPLIADFAYCWPPLPCCCLARSANNTCHSNLISAPQLHLVISCPYVPPTTPISCPPSWASASSLTSPPPPICASLKAGTTYPHCQSAIISAFMLVNATHTNEFALATWPPP